VSPKWEVKSKRKTQYWREFFFFSKHWQSGGKNAIKNAKQDSPFGNFFRIRWNVESYDDKEGKVIFHATRILTRGMVAKICVPPFSPQEFLRLSIFFGMSLSLHVGGRRLQATDILNGEFK
jgi:hypothetical protein